MNSVVSIISCKMKVNKDRYCVSIPQEMKGTSEILDTYLYVSVCSL